MSRSGDEICREITQLHEGIAGSMILEKGSLRAMHVKPGSTIPKEIRIESMASQADMLAGTVRTSAEYFGELHYLMTHSDKADLFFFPVMLNGRRMSLAVVVNKAYQHQEMSELIRRYLGEMMAKRT